MAKIYKFEFGVKYFSGEGIQAHGALKPLRDVLWDVTDGTYTTVEVEEHLPWRLEEEGRKAKRKDVYYGTCDVEGKGMLEAALRQTSSDYEVFLSIVEE
jgi:hypothetical protein